MEINDVIDSQLKEILPRNEKFKSMFNYAVSGGKKVRPKILLLSCRAVEGNIDKALSIAASLELLHKSSLVHDDILDNDDLRRGKPTFHKQYNINYAIFMGDFIFSQAFELIKKSKITIDEKNACYKLFSQVSYSLFLGQIHDTKNKKFVTEDDYFKIVYLKSGALIENTARLGALLGGGSTKEQNALAAYGKNFALAMQILNDIKDTMDTENRRAEGKASDIEENKWNILLIHAFENTQYGNKRELLRIMNQKEKSEKEIKQVQDIIKNTNSVEYARKKASKYFNEAKQNLDSLRPTEAKDTLLKLADIAVDKAYWKSK